MESQKAMLSLLQGAEEGIRDHFSLLRSKLAHKATSVLSAGFVLSD